MKAIKKNYFSYLLFYLQFVSFFHISIFFITILFGVLIDLTGISLLIPLFEIILNGSLNDIDFKIPFLKNFFNKNFYEINIICFFILLIFFIRFILSIITIYIQSKISMNLKIKIPIRIFEQLIIQDVSYFKEISETTLIRDLLHETKLCSNVLIIFITLLADIILVIFFIVFLFILYPNIALGIFLLIILFSYLYIFFSNKIIRQSGINRQKFTPLLLINIKNLFHGFREYVLNIGFKNLLSDFEFNFWNVERAHQKSFIIQNIPRYYYEFIIILTVISLIIFLNISGEKNSNIIATISILVVVAYKLITQINKILISYQQILFNLPAVVLIKDLFEKFNYLKSSFPSLYQKKIDNIDCINFVDISYRYKNHNKYVLKNLNLKINKNDKILLMGDSGSGKSTLFDLIAGFISPESGNIFINEEIPISNLLSIKNKISYLSKNTYIFNVSFLKNIILSNKYDKKLITKIYDICNLNEVINDLPQREKTQLDMEKIKLSSGQIQRIGIARALYKLPDIILLDEATTSLDTSTEKKILNYLLNKKNLTLLIINHNSINNNLFDKKIILKNNKLYY